MPNITQLINLRKSPVVRSIGIYTFSNFFAKGASFLLLIVFTNPNYILPSENGLLSLFSTSMLFLMPFLSMGIIHSTSTDFFKLDKQEFRSFFTTGFVMPVLITIISICILFFFRKQLQLTYGFPNMFIWIIPIVTFFTFCNEQLLSLARNNNEPLTFLKINAFKTVMELGLSFLLVVFFYWRWEGRVAGIFVAYFLTGIFAVYYFIKRGYLFGTVKKQYIVNELVYAVPIIVMQVSIFSMNSSDKFFLSHFTSDKNETVGIYSVGCIFASIVLLISSALIQYVFPKVYTTLAAKKVDYHAIKRYFLLYAGGMAAGTLLIILLTPVLYHNFINVKYHPALRYTYLLALGYFLWTVSYFFYSFLLYNKKKKKILALSLCCITISLSCNYFFISQWRDLGGGLSVFFCYALVLLLTLVFTKEFWKQFLFISWKAPVIINSEIKAPVV